MVLSCSVGQIPDGKIERDFVGELLRVYVCFLEGKATSLNVDHLQSTTLNL